MMIALLALGSLSGGVNQAAAEPPSPPGEHGSAKGEPPVASKAAKPPPSAPRADKRGGAAQKHGAAPSMGSEPKAIAKALLDGNARYSAGEATCPDLTKQRAGSAGGQHPGAMILGCADSRVPPELIFDRGIGELFVVRSAGNIAEPVSVGSLEYGAEHLHIKVLLVLGHDKCGAVTAALSEGKMPSPNLEALVGYITPATKGLKSWSDGPDLLRIAVEANVRRQAEELLRRSPILRAAVAKGQVTLLKGVYDIETGRVRPL